MRYKHTAYKKSNIKTKITCNFLFSFRYIPDEINPHNCKPNCEYGCKQGTCIGPNNCRCNEGYKPSQTNNTCIPDCAQSCENGQCISPGKCSCNEGYELNVTGVCSPVCNPECINGSCVAPGVCSCYSEFEPSEDKNKCVAICKDCVNGKCIDGVCECQEDWTGSDCSVPYLGGLDDVEIA